MKPLRPKVIFQQMILLIAIACLPDAGKGQNFPPISMVIEDSAATQGYYFLVPYTNVPQGNYDHAQLILDRYGRVVFYRLFDTDLNPTPTIDFKLQPNGMMSYYNINRKRHILMDSTFTDVDSIWCIHGYETDQHDLQVLPNNHYLMFGSETRIMNLSSYHWFGFNHNLPGSSNAQVIGVVIQEFDENKNMVWEWKAHDHYQFGDADSIWLFNPNKVDWTHANAVEMDTDGNILLSLRHFNEITKIDHATGNIIWRLGGKQNQFTFPNDPLRFTGQHDIRRVNGDTISIFDNGQYTNPPVSRGLEYALDEQNRIATLAWEYIYDSSMYSIACGNFQNIANGNHLVDFGFADSEFPWMVVVRPDKTKVLEMNYPAGYISYRAFNYLSLPWDLHRPNVECEKTGDSYFLVAEEGHPEYLWSTGETTSSIQVTGTGEYWVFVPRGAGYISSERILVTDPENPCLFTGLTGSAMADGPTLKCMPNPVSGQTRILFSLQVGSNVSISLVSMTGVEVMNPVRGFYSAGSHEATLDASSLKSGIYILVMTLDEARITSRVVVL